MRGEHLFTHRGENRIPYPWRATNHSNNKKNISYKDWVEPFA